METLKQERDRLRNVENTINESSKTLRLQPVGGLGAMTQRINAKPQYEKKPTTISFASPGSSSLPYLSDEQKVKSNENVLMLAVHHAQQREAVKAHYIDLDKKQADLEDRIENDITTFTKNFEPSTENLLKNFLLGEIKKRNAEEQDLIKKRMERADLELNPPARIPERRRFAGFFDADGQTLFSRDSNLDQSLVNRELQRRAREGDEEIALNERERRLDEADESVSQLVPSERRGYQRVAGTEISNYPPSEGGGQGFLPSSIGGGRYPASASIRGYSSASSFGGAINEYNRGGARRGRPARGGAVSAGPVGRRGRRPVPAEARPLLGLAPRAGGGEEERRALGYGRLSTSSSSASERARLMAGGGRSTGGSSGYGGGSDVSEIRRRLARGI